MRHSGVITAPHCSLAAVVCGREPLLLSAQGKLPLHLGYYHTSTWHLSVISLAMQVLNWSTDVPMLRHLVLLSMDVLQNEIEYEDAVKLVNKGVAMVLEGANMPSTNDAIAHFHKCGVVLAAAKACNAGGLLLLQTAVLVSQLLSDCSWQVFPLVDCFMQMCNTMLRWISIETL
jgi:hypothetical protein